MTCSNKIALPVNCSDYEFNQPQLYTGQAIRFEYKNNKEIKLGDKIICSYEGLKYYGEVVDIIDNLRYTVNILRTN